MSYKFSIKDFEGPLDLLLHLIQKKEMDILDINVNILVDQYVSFIREQKNLKLEIASEYLVMASYLIELKSKAIIPIEEVNIDGEYEQSEKQKLIKKLIEYKKYKKTVLFFEEALEERSKVFTRDPESLKHLEILWQDRGVAGNMKPDILSNALTIMFERLAKEKPLITFVPTVLINMEKLELDIIKKVHKSVKFNFIDLFSKRWDRAFIIATIICLLDLTKNRLIKINQEKSFGNIYIERS